VLDSDYVMTITEFDLFEEFATNFINLLHRDQAKGVHVHLCSTAVAHTY